MWIRNTDTGQWRADTDTLSEFNFSSWKQDMSTFRLYQKCLSGATYVPITGFNDIYDILGEYKPRTWYLGLTYSGPIPYIPPQATKVKIDGSSVIDYYTDFLSEDGLAMKSLFTPKRILGDSVDNYYTVDVVTTEQLSRPFQGKYLPNLIIDGVRLREGHRVLVKDQVDYVTLPVATDPNTYFTSNYYTYSSNALEVVYYYYTPDNGIYKYTSGALEREPDLEYYDVCIRYSVSCKLGNINYQKQFHLNRLLSGYFPISTFVHADPIEFTEKHNYILRNQVDYNNLFEIVYNDCLKHSTQSLYLGGITYSIPTRTISVGEFGLIVVYQEGVANIVQNKYKVILESISETPENYWVCGDYGTILKVSKLDLSVQRVDLGILTKLNSISFFNESRGVVVGLYNIIYYTDNGGYIWNQISVADFEAFNYNVVIYPKIDAIYIGGDTGVFLELIYNQGSWISYKRRVSKFNNIDDEYILVENINDLFFGVSDNQLAIACDNSMIFIYDLNRSFGSGFDFNFFDVSNIGDIKNFIGSPPYAYFGSNNLYEIDFSTFTLTSSVFSNVFLGSATPSLVAEINTNSIFNFNNEELVVCGNTSLFSVYGFTSGNSDIYKISDLDINYNNRLKSRLLFMDYDIGSKLNFFDDLGVYRLPNSVSFTASYLDSNILEFTHLTQSNVPFSVTESNWITYWKDRSKTFKYYTHMDEPFVVTPNFTFSNSNICNGTFSYTASQISISLSDILPMAPNIQSTTQSRYINTGSTIFPISSYNLYLYDYLMIWVFTSSGTLRKPVPGDMVRISCDAVEATLMINKVIEISGPHSKTYYQYIYTDFNQNITTNIKNCSVVNLTNLNKYTNLIGHQEFVDKFNFHPVHWSYKASLQDLGTSSVDISPRFNNMSSYYNLQCGIKVGANKFEMRYPFSFFQFGYNPTYNLLDYLSSLNSDNYFPSRELSSLPVYDPMPGTYYGSFTGATDSNIYTEAVTPKLANKLFFGKNLVDQWTSILKWTFVDVSVQEQGTLTVFTTKKLLVMDKYYDPTYGWYVIEFHKAFSQPLYSIQVQVRTRRTLQEISDDLQYLNTLHRNKDLTKVIESGYDYSNYETDINFKIPTDSYAKAFLSDDQFVKDISGIAYIDYKNELALDITKLEIEYITPIANTNQYIVGPNTWILFNCSESHHLSDGDGVVIDMNGGSGSSQETNPQYMGYHVAHPISLQDFYIQIPYGIAPSVSDIGTVTFIQKDPFLNFQPVNLFDVGQGPSSVKQSIKINPENYELVGSKYNLINMDKAKYTYKLVDGLTLDVVTNKYPWILDAEIQDAVIGLDSNNNIQWYSGIWDCGRWFGGHWLSGIWLGGDWYSGTWESKSSGSKWYDGRWFDGTWVDGKWFNGRRYSGTWSGGVWYNGVWNNGTFEDGEFSGGIWVDGSWKDGIFNTNNTPAYWLDGKWTGGDFENGMWYNGVWDQKDNKVSRFGTKSYNSRTSTWRGGKWLSGQFHSQLNLNSSGSPIVSNIHKYSIWETGFWGSGDFWGGIAYNIDFRGGIWHGGILDDIQIIGINSATASIYGNTFSNYITLNGIFKLNIGDDLWIIDNGVNNLYSALGSNVEPRRCKALFVLEEGTNTHVEIDVKLSYESFTPFPSGVGISDYNTGLRVVSKWTNSIFDSGIWTNGILDNSHFNGGIWYNGVVENSYFQ